MGAARLGGDASRTQRYKTRALELDTLNRRACHRDKYLSPADIEFLKAR